MNIVPILVLNYVLLGLVVYAGAKLLEWFPRSRQWSLPARLAWSHTILLAGCMVLYPTGWFVAEPPYDDIYVAYLFIPGLLLAWLGGMAGGWVWLWAQHALDYHTASILCIVIVPGVVGLVLGGLQWYVLGWLMEKFPPRKKFRA